MKYAILSLGGALGMGLSIIADAMKGFNGADNYAGIGCGVMIVGLLGVIAPAILQWFKNGNA